MPGSFKAFYFAKSRKLLFGFQVENTSVEKIGLLHHLYVAELVRRGLGEGSNWPIGQGDVPESSGLNQRQRVRVTIEKVAFSL